jgi:hypothetical protein
MSLSRFFGFALHGFFLGFELVDYFQNVVCQLTHRETQPELRPATDYARKANRDTAQKVSYTSFSWASVEPPQAFKTSVLSGT